MGRPRAVCPFHCRCARGAHRQRTTDAAKCALEPAESGAERAWLVPSTSCRPRTGEGVHAPILGSGTHKTALHILNWSRTPCEEAASAESDWARPPKCFMGGLGDLDVALPRL